MVLVGLACKNAILIVEFDSKCKVQLLLKQQLKQVVTSNFNDLYCIHYGCRPTGTGAGSEMRHAMGVAVFFAG